jgi:hypothetical protein
VNALAGASLYVNVYASPGIPAQELAVTVYAAGDNVEPVAWQNTAVAEFALPPGRYDVLVQVYYAEEWLRNVEVSDGQTARRDVVFDFGVLQLSARQDDRLVPVDFVTYPSGDRQNWVDWRSDNPTSIQLRAGTYDIEVAYADSEETEIVTGLVIRAGEVTAKEIEIKTLR